MSNEIKDQSLNSDISSNLNTPHQDLDKPSDDWSSVARLNQSTYEDSNYYYSSTGNYLDPGTRSPWSFDDDDAPWNYENVSILAPMVRAGTLPLRWLARERGCSIAYTEETIDLKLAKCIRRVCKRTGLIEYVLPHEISAAEASSKSTFHKVFHTYPGERVALQLGTGNAVNALRAAMNVAPDVRAIDINMGCPKLFSIQGAMGSALLSKPEIVADIISTLKRNLTIPVTCKIRLLQDPARTVDLVRIAEKCGVDAIAVHARFREDRPRHRALPALQTPLLASAVSVPIIHNGDVFLWEDIERFRSAAAVSSVMIGRGAMWNPSVFGRRFPWEDQECTSSLESKWTGATDDDDTDMQVDFIDQCDAQGNHSDWTHAIVSAGSESAIRDKMRAGLDEVCPVKMMDFILSRRDRRGAVPLPPRRRRQGILDSDLMDPQAEGQGDEETGVSTTLFPHPVVCSYQNPSVTVKTPKKSANSTKNDEQVDGESQLLGVKRSTCQTTDESSTDCQTDLKATDVARAPPGVHASVELGLPPDLNWEWSDEYPHFARRVSSRMVPPYSVASRYAHVAAACETGVSNCKFGLGEIFKMCPKACGSSPFAEDFPKAKSYLAMMRCVELVRKVPSVSRPYRAPFVPAQYELRPKTGLAPELRGNSKRIREERKFLLAERAREDEEQIQTRGSQIQPGSSNDE